MQNKKGQEETGKMLLYLLIAVISFILIAYFGYALYKSKTSEFTQEAPRIIPALLAIPMLKEANMKKIFGKGGVSPIIYGIIGAILAIIFVLVAIRVFSIFK